MKMIKHYIENINLTSRRGFLILAALVLGLSPLVFTSGQANAAALTSKSATLTNSDPTAVSDHTVQFTTPTGVIDDGSTIIVEWDTQGTTDEFDFTGVTAGDVDIEDDGVDKTTAADCTGTEHFGVNVDTSGDQITFTACTGDNGDIAAGSVVTVKVGTNADSGTDQITNPAAGVYDIAVSGTFGDTGSMLVAIVDNVDVSATVAETLTFTIAAVADTACDDLADSGTVAAYRTTTATTVPFGTLSSTDFYAACQDLTVTTNAASGYSTTAQENRNLKSAGGDFIVDTDCDSTCTTSAGTTWATETNEGFGYFCENGTGSPCPAAGIANYKQFACTGSGADCDGSGSESAQNVMTETGPVDADSSRIHYKISIGGTQEAGTFTNEVTYIATPIF